MKRIGVPFEFAIVASEIGSYKPAHRHWEAFDNKTGATRSAHVHVADKLGRVPPGESGNTDYRPLFQILKAGGYDSLISVEGNFPEAMIRERGGRILDFLKQQWQES